MAEPENKWLFADPRNTAVFTTRFVVRDGKPILHVAHDLEDGAWQFHSENAFGLKDAMVVGLGEIVDLDATIMELVDLPFGYSANRVAVGAEWIIAKSEPHHP
jgi:hypothetical protein